MFLGVAKLVQTISVAEQHLHDQPHGQPLAAIDDGSMSLIVVVYLAAWSYRRLGRRE